MSDTAQHNDNNGRTLAVLVERVDVVIRQQGQLLQEFSQHRNESARRDERITKVETEIKEARSDVCDLNTDVENLKTRDWLVGGIATALATIVGIIAAILGLKSP